MIKRPTMRDVATAAGVSLMTVSRVVNGEPGVLPETATSSTETPSAAPASCSLSAVSGLMVLSSMILE